MGWWMLPMAVGAGMGALKNKRAQEVENSDRKLAAETQRYSPWTGLKAQPIRQAGSTFGDVLGGGMAGFGVAQSAGLFGGGGGDTPTGGTENMVAQKGVGVNYQPGMLGAKTKLSMFDEDPLQLGSGFLTAKRP
jgi:hypothetical protein